MIQKKFYIKTLGCKVNQYESQVIRENFLKNGYIEAGSSDEADICVINTCTVTSTSDSKSLKLIRSGLRKKNKCIIATGCMIESGDLDLRKLKGVDFIIKNKDKYRIPQIIYSFLNPLEPRIFMDLEPNIITGFHGHSRAFVKIQDGCSNKCSYCKVSVVRGKSASRPFERIIEECSALIEKGYNEIVLSGICLGAYGKDISKTASLTKLIKNICKIKGDWRVRLSSIEPKDVTDDLILQIVSEEKICKHLHIPFQSGDNEILKRMNRPYTVSDYMRIVARLRKTIPDIAVSTDMMVGFPGEEEANFRNTLNFIKEISPMRLHVFGFSKRIGTPAYSYKGIVDNIVKKQREHALLDAVSGFSREFEKMFIGKIARVLIEDKRDKQGFLQGYTDRYIKVLIDGPDSVKSRLLTCQLTLSPPLLLEQKTQPKAMAGLTKQKVYGILLSYLD
ncbi:MAG: tRNA (N(6)-L-threonylcarbamoyladenosine(37)-C(2))-methylthiotransferase MtaB [Candidatus Omnitrophica bacterium]|nr:tRNA (N(6)-L-threonylcarbamoyladenosine(37)-C(2))-methylthiotransferase MtaB [Candidatus Omnitrophota bacterium]